MQKRPLSGIRVLDLTNVLAGPYCSYQLMLLGAEVVKIEVPGQGDLARHLGPDADLNGRGLGASFLAQNAGKKSVEIDLKDAAGRAGFEDMVRGADVLLENFRAGVLALVEDAVRDGIVPGAHLRAGLAVETHLAKGRAKPVPMNIDGATAIIYAELGFQAPLARGLFVLSRSIGILAHAWEESQQNQRNKGPIPRTVLPAHRP